MASFVKRLTGYVKASANAKLDEKADPKIQIQQAIEGAQRQHAQLTQQAAAVIGNQHQLEMKMARAADDSRKLQESARQALLLADRSRAAGDAAKAADYDQAAQTFAGQLVTVEKQLDDLKSLHGQATQAAAAAHRAVEQNRMQLEQQLAERSKLMTQLEQAKMQEQMNKAVSGMSELSAPGSTPTLDSVREKIEGRYATALGAGELTHDTVDARMLEVQRATLDASASSRLDEIRAAMAAPDEAPAALTGGTAGELTSGAADPVAEPAGGDAGAG
jgi:phage shock protein A